MNSFNVVAVIATGLMAIGEEEAANRRQWATGRIWMRRIPA
jgi:hypothetical protein